MSAMLCHNGFNQGLSSRSRANHAHFSGVVCFMASQAGLLWIAPGTPFRSRV